MELNTPSFSFFLSLSLFLSLNRVHTPTLSSHILSTIYLSIYLSIYIQYQECVHRQP